MSLTQDERSFAGTDCVECARSSYGPNSIHLVDREDYYSGRSYCSERCLHAGSGLGAEVADDPIPPAVRAVLTRIEETFTRKNQDYAERCATWSSNFEDVARQMGWGQAQEAAEAMVAVKQARLRSLRSNGAAPVNEAMEDTLLDRAVYAVISLALQPSLDSETPC